MRPVTDQPDWVSVDVFVDVELDDGRLVSRPRPAYIRGGPLDCTRRELDETIRRSVFSEPRHHPADPPTEPHSLVGQLQPFGIEVTLDALAALPLTITLSDEVEALR